MKCRKNKRQKGKLLTGFTIIEILIVIAIISFLASIIVVSTQGVMSKTYFTKASADIRSLGLALQLFLMDNNYNLPCDVSRNLPNGLEAYITNNNWPKGPWPGSVYDWDYWHPDPSSTGPGPDGGYCGGNLDIDGNPEHDKAVYQLSIRFCDIGGGNCHFPNETWAAGFDSKSSVYWCISGPCRAHGDESYNHKGCCIGGACPSDQPHCGI